MKRVYAEETLLQISGNDTYLFAKKPEVMPIYHSTAYIIEDTHDYDYANGGGKYFYSRTANPNRDALANSISILENGEATLVCSSGMGAITTTLLSLLKSGDHIVFSQAIYGETIEVADLLLKKFGIEISFADFTNLEDIKTKIKSNTRLFYTEIVANPLTHIVDIDKIVCVAKEKNILVIVDSTFTTPFAIKPLDHQVDIVLHSLTKYFGGHSDITGGSITGEKILIDKIRPLYLLIGSSMDPNSSWLAHRSVKTMGMRVKRQFSNASKLAMKLNQLPMIRAVYHPSLETHPQYQLARQLLDDYGAIISIRVEDDRGKVDAFIRRLKLVKYLGTLGGMNTSIAHPATAFKTEFSDEKLKSMGMYEGLIRISVGVEDIDDIYNDFEQALIVFN